MATMQLSTDAERPALMCSSCSAAPSTLRRCTSRGWWLARGGWLALASSCSASSLDSPRTRRPSGQPHDRGPSQPPLRLAVRVGVLRRRRTVGQCLSGPGAPYLCAGTGGSVATGTHRLPGLRSPLLRDSCAWTQAHRVAGLCVCAAPGGTPDSPAAWVDDHTVCGSGPRQDAQRVRPAGGALRRGFCPLTRLGSATSSRSRCRTSS